MTTTRYTRVKGSPGIYRYETKAGETRYSVAYDREPDWRTGKRNQARKGTFTTLKEAKAFQTAMRERRRRGDTVTYSMEPLGAYLEQWIDSRATEVRPNTIRGYRAAAKWLESLAPVPLSRVSAAQIERVYGDWVRSGRAASTVRIMHTLLNSALTQAHRHNLIPVNPCSAVKLPRMNPSTKRAWTVEQASAFLASEGNDPVWGLLWTVALHTWLRPGELLALSWQDIDLEDGTLTVRRTMTRDVDGRAMVGPVKTERSRRTIPLAPSLVERLRAHRQQQRIYWLAIGRRWSDEALVFPGGDGQMYPQASLRAGLAGACRRAGVPTLLPHELRHTGASIATLAGMDPRTLSERLGHSSVSFSLSVYSKSNADHQRKASEQMAVLLDGTG